MTEVAIVTGASRGIGAATARLLGASGYAVCVNYLVADEAAARVVADVERAGGRAIAVQADVASPDDVGRLFEESDAQLGRLTALVNNAGVHGPRSAFAALEREAIEEVFAVNVLGLMACTRAAIARMSRRNGGAGGAIVNVSSGAATQGSAFDGVPYAASKGAVSSFTVGVAQEVAADGIRVNAVSPGLIWTDMPPEEKLERVGPAIPAGRAGEPEEIAEAIRWLLSPQASYVTGANLRVAGGKP